MAARGGYSPDAQDAARRLTMYPMAHMGSEAMAQETQVSHGQDQGSSFLGGRSGGRDEEGGSMQKKSSIMRSLAQTFMELDASETTHTQSLVQEEQRSRERYIAQFQSVAAKCQSLDEEFGNDSRFRKDFSEALSQYEQEQRRDVGEFSQDMEALRDLDRLVRGALPAQLEALAGLAHDIQASLKTKADATATKTRLQMIEQRLTRLEQSLNQKADTSDLKYLEERLDQVLVQRTMLAGTFRKVGDLIEPAGGNAPRKVK